MWVKKLLIAAVIGLVAGQANAHDNRRPYHGNGRHGAHDIVYARVVSVQPVVRYVTVERPRQECWQDVEYRSAVPGRVAATTLAGGIVGAAIGRQFGDGSGQDALTVLGGLAGSFVAHEHAMRRTAGSTYVIPVERCQVVSERFTEQVIDGYDVVYQYHGRMYSMRTAQHPGSRIALEMNLRPVRL